VKYRAFRSVLPVPFLVAGAFLFLTGPVSADVVVQGGGEDHYPTTTMAGSTNPLTVPTTVERKVTICHLPPGNPPNFQIISIGISALPAHLAHGDIYPVPASGICFVAPTTTAPVGTNPLTVPTTTTIPTTTTTSTTVPEETTTTVPPGTTPFTSPTTIPTTTIPGETTTTAPPTVTEFLSIGSAASVCSNDVPFVDITFGNQPEFNGIVGTITFQTLDGTFIEVHEVTYQANETVRLLYPGASFDPVTGEATDWPGWMLNDDGFWVLDPSDSEFRDGLIVVAEINPTATTTITYPPETAACNSPEGPFPAGGPGTSQSGSLPETGLQGLGIALLLVGIAVGLGNAALQASHKRNV